MVCISDDLRFNLPCGSELNPFVKQSSVIEFAEKMNKPTVKMVSSVGEVVSMLQQDGDDCNEVVFVSYDTK